METVSVVVAAYTLDRWRNIEACIDSLHKQTVPPEQIIICIDNNAELYERAKVRFDNDGQLPITVIENPDRDHLMGGDTHARVHGQRRRFGAGSARNAASALVRSDVIAFIDDDAWAEPDWVSRTSEHFADSSIVALGGAPIPDYEAPPPDWFPGSFRWVFGCAYRGLPETAGPAKHLIGASMAVRRSAFEAVGGFHSIDFDDLDLCLRLGHTFGGEAIMYDPDVQVHHHVPSDRTTWRYFTRRCFYVNAEKVTAFRDLGDASTLSAELRFAAKALTTEIAYEAARAVRQRSLTAALACVAIPVGLSLAGLGNLWGRIRDLDLARFGRRAAPGSE